MSIFYVRHGQTDWNQQGLLQGQSDIPLNAEGIRQAQKTRDQLHEVSIGRIICSPLQRTRMTASILNENWALQIEEDERLLERSFGDIEGKTLQAYPFDKFWDFHEPLQYHMESLASLFQRVYQFLDSIQQDAREQHILIVAHGGVSIPFACYFDEANSEKDLMSLILKNCEIARRESIPYIKEIG